MASLAQQIAETGKHCYAILFGVRSGSTMLCDDLRAWGFGAPTEYFQEPLYLLSERPVREYVLEVVQQGASPWFGFKINWHQANSLIARLAAEGDCAPDASIWSLFPGLRTVHLVRDDKVLQAVSGWRAAMTNIWHVPAGEVPDAGRPPYDFEGIRTFFNAVVTEDWMWADHFRSLGVVPAEVHYEDYIRNRRSALRGLASYLGDPAADAPIDDYMAVMRDDWSHETAALFRAHLRNPDHEYFEIWSRLVAGQGEAGGAASVAA